VKLLSPAEVKAYTRDLVALLTETDIVKSKGFLRSFIDRIIIEGNKGTIYFKLPVPPEWKEKEEFSVTLIHFVTCSLRRRELI
jgi:hypothetical protein